MKISYMLVNNFGLGLSMPIGAAWHWIHQVDDEKHMRSVLERLKRIIHPYEGDEEEILQQA